MPEPIRERSGLGLSPVQVLHGLGRCADTVTRLLQRALAHEAQDAFLLAMDRIAVAAAARQAVAQLLHKDPEFRAIPGLSQAWLG